uniref:Protein arginine N-methyltransferase domain-containing protein n=1 Tax=Globisporangium ultimum (strain ATCC 200006 / CBS 805.95 / DAOM BR144) TaxID=431595 RepID=K3X5J8_GLOUD
MYAGVDKYGGAVVGEGQPDGSAPAAGSAATGLSLEEAVETAAAEETVVVDVPYSYYEDDADESSLVTGTSQVLLTAQLNPEAGGLMWVEQESSQDAYKNVVAMSQMTSMLRDLDRNRCYELGIKGAIERFVARHKRAPIVLDIGTGTGLLSMFAATHGAEHVYACEMFKPMADIAENVTKANHPDKITVFALRSTDLIVASEESGGVGHLPRRADMLVSELFDSILLGEAVIPVVRHAIEHLLVPDAAILPERATVFAHVVQNEQIYRLNSVSGQFLNDQQAQLARNDAAWECTGGKPALPLHYRALEPQSTPLTNVTPVLSFDFTKPIASATTYEETVVNAVASGDVHAVVMWWEVSFGDDAESSIVYSTKPGAQNWQDHWVPVVFPLTEHVHVDASDAVVLRTHHDDLHIWFDVELQQEPQTQLSSPSKKKMKQQQVQREKMPCTCGLHLQRKTDRQQDNEDLACLDISDGSLCALLAASQGVANVTSVESKDVSARIFQQILDNQPTASETQVEVLCCGCKGLLPDHLQGGKPVDLLLGEPFYYSMQNLPLWQAFNFWLRRSAVAPTLAPNALVLPARARVCALAVRFEHLHECFGAVGDVSGYDHSYFDQFQESYYTRNFPFPVYMYPYEAVSGVLTLAKCEYQSVAESVFTELTTELPQEPNGVIVWVEYALDAEEKHVVATGPAAIHSKQLVRFLAPSAATTAGQNATKVSLQSRFHFNALEGTIDVDFAIV